MVGISLATVASLSATVAAAASSPSLGAVAPDPSTLSEWIQEPKCTLVEFYAPWCGHCKQLAPTYEQLGGLFNTADLPRVVKVDATDEGFGDIVAANSVRSFPTIQLFHGEKVGGLAYNGDRTLANMVEFINSNCDTSVEAQEQEFALSPPAAEIAAMIAPTSAADCVMLEFYAPWCGHCKNLAPTYEGLGQLFNSIPRGPRVLKIDATNRAYGALSQEFQVRGYPTLILVGPVDETSGKREHIAYDRRREIPEFVEFINEECGTSVAVPKNFQPPKPKGQDKPDPVLEFAIRFNGYISRFEFDEGMEVGYANLDKFPRLRTNVDKTARRLKSIGYKVPAENSVLQGAYQVLHPQGQAASDVPLIPSADSGAVVSVLMHLEVSSPRMKEDLLAMSKIASENDKAYFIGLTSASRAATLNKRDRKNLMNVVEVDDSLWIPYAFVKESWDVVVVTTATREILWAGGTHQFKQHTLDRAIDLATGGNTDTVGGGSDSGGCSAEGADACDGGDEDSLDSLTEQMEAAAKALEFEKAAELRDRIKSLQRAEAASRKEADRIAGVVTKTPNEVAREKVANIYEQDWESSDEL